MSLNITNVNIYLVAKTPSELIEKQLINNALNGVHYNYQTPIYDGSDWFVWFFADLKRWQDPSELSFKDLSVLGVEGV